MTIHHIAFRVDASSQIGTGHFMRCLTLAECLKQYGAKIRFISHNLPFHLCDILTSKGIEIISFDHKTKDLITGELNHSHWLGSNQEHDAKTSIQALSDQSWDWLIVDHYALDIRWENILRQHVKNILVIDDLADRQHDCDILLDQDFYTDMHTRYKDKVPAHCQLLLGPHYCLLRNEFWLAQKLAKPRSGNIKRLFVFFGGVDIDNDTGQVIEALSVINISKIQVDVVIGKQHPFLEQISSMCLRHKFICHIQTNKIAALMAEADLAIGAGGMATWERIFLGLPSLVKITAFNQIEALNYLASAGYVSIWRDTNELICLLNQRIKSNTPLPLFDISIGTDTVAECIFKTDLLKLFGVEHVRQTFNRN